MKLAHEVDEILNDAVVEEKVGRLKIIVEQLRTKLSVLWKFDKEILSLCDVKEIEHEIEEAEEISAKIFGYQRQIKVLLKPVPSLLPGVFLPPVAAATSRSRLPKLQL